MADYKEMLDRNEKEKQRLKLLAKEEILKAFSIFEKDNQISIVLLQKNLGFGYIRAKNFIKYIATKGIIDWPEDRLSMVPVKDIKLLKDEAVSFFEDVYIDKIKLSELSKYKSYVFALKGDFKASDVSWYWFQDLIEEFVKDDEFVKLMKDIFNIDVRKIKSPKEKVEKIFSDIVINFNMLVVVVLGYFANKLKRKTLQESNNIDTKLKEKIEKLRF